MAVGGSFTASGVGYVTPPYTLYARARTSDNTAWYTALHVKDPTNGDYFKISNNGSNRDWQAEHYDGASNWKQDLWTTNTVNNQWYSLAGASTNNSTNREVAVNAVWTGTPNTTSNPVAWSSFESQLGGTPGESLDHAIYSVKLVAAELRMLDLGISPLMVRSDALERFWLSREAHSNTLQEVMQGGSATSGTPVYADNPSPVIYPVGPIIGKPPAVAATLPSMRGYSGYAARPYSAPAGVAAGGGGGGGGGEVTVIPGGLQFLDRQFATVIAARLGGVIQ